MRGLVALRSARVVPGVAVLAFGGVFTALAWLLPGFDVAYGGEGMHIALDAIQATVCLVVGCLAWARFARGRQLGDLVVVAALGIVMTVESAFLLALPTLLNYEQLRPFSVWSSTVAAALSAVLLLGGAFAGQRQVTTSRATVLLLGATVLTLGLAAGIILAYEQRLPLAIDPALSPVAAGRRAFTGEGAILIIQGFAGTLLLAAGAKSILSRNADVRPFFGWLGPALLADGLASLNYALFPSLYSYWVYTGDILCLAFVVLLTWGIIVELRASARRAIEVAVLEERRRLARDLHDGVAQELAFIAAEIVDIPSDVHPSLPWIRSAVERGLYESRRAIAALTLPLNMPLASAIAGAVEDITARAGTSVRLQLDETVQVSAAEREAILRVVREAAMNAIKHGGAQTIRVTLEAADTQLTRLQVADDGTGLDIDAITHGFGLTSMRERIHATGGELQLESRADAGTTIEARWTRAPERKPTRPWRRNLLSTRTPR